MDEGIKQNPNILFLQIKQQFYDLVFANKKRSNNLSFSTKTAVWKFSFADKQPSIQSECHSFIMTQNAPLHLQMKLL